MSFEDAWKDATAVQFLGEQVAETGSTAQVLFRVKDKKQFSKLLVEAMKAVEDDAAFGFRAQKQYFLDDEGKPTFSWMLMLWGAGEDWLDEAVTVIGPILGRQVQAPVKLAPPPEIVPLVESRGGKVKFLRERVAQGMGNKEPYKMWTAPLPHRSRDRNNIPAADRKPRTIHDLHKPQQVWVDDGISDPLAGIGRGGL